MEPVAKLRNGHSPGTDQRLPDGNMHRGLRASQGMAGGGLPDYDGMFSWRQFRQIDAAGAMVGIAVDNRFSTINVDMEMIAAMIRMYVKFKHRSTVDDRAVFWRQDGNGSVPYVSRKG